MLRGDTTVLISVSPPLPHVLLKLANDPEVGAMLDLPTLSRPV